MKLEIENPGPEIHDAEVTQVESLLPSALPADYRRFLLESNGGQPWPDTVDVEGFSGSPIDVSMIFGINREIETSCLSWAIRVYSNFVDRGLLPVATDSGGNLIILILKGERIGCIQYCDLSSPGLNVFDISVSFDSFLDKIREY